MRLTNEQLQEVKKKYGVDKLYSWSMINTFMTSKYEYFLHYILHKKEDRDNSAYAPLGGISHEIIENFYNKKIEYKDMINDFIDGWTTAIDIADLKFDRNDELKNETIRNKYKDNLMHFFKNHKVLKGNVELERFLTAKIGEYVLQGYVDAITKDDDGCFNIIDWKTSTKYSGKTLDEHSGQLTVYAIALNQLGVPLDKIKVCFNFLKYVTIQYEQKDGTVKTRDVERIKIGESLQSNAKTWLKEFGYDVDEYLKLLLDTNSIDCLPKEIQEKYIISDCYVYVPLTVESIDKWTTCIINTIKDIELREKDYDENNSDKCFWDTDESVKSQSYYFSTLCGYSANLHKPYKEYLDRLEDAKNGSDLLNGVGSEIDSSINNSSVNDMDMSWLNEI